MSHLDGLEQAVDRRRAAQWVAEGGGVLPALAAFLRGRDDEFAAFRRSGGSSQGPGEPVDAQWVRSTSHAPAPKAASLSQSGGNSGSALELQSPPPPAAAAAAPLTDSDSDSDSRRTATWWWLASGYYIVCLVRASDPDAPTSARAVVTTVASALEAAG